MKRKRRSGVGGIDRLGWLLALLALLGWALSSEAGASGAIYRFTDQDGVVHFSDSPVDPRFTRIPLGRKHGLVIAPRSLRPGPARREYDGLIVQLGRRHRVQPALVKAVIAAESNFEPAAVSRVGAQGLMQLMPATAQELGVERPFVVRENIDGGVRYLRRMLDRYGDVRRALAAYNAGPTAVDRYGGIPPYPETQTYVARVLEYYHGYRVDFEDDPYARGDR